MQRRTVGGEEVLARRGLPEGHTQVVQGEESLTLTIPPVGLASNMLVPVVVLGIGGVVVLISAVLVLPVNVLSVPGLLVLACGISLSAAAVLTALQAMLDVARVEVSPPGIRVTHTFPTQTSGEIPRQEFLAVVVGNRRLLQRGYFCHSWGQRGVEIVVKGVADNLSFGRGLARAEQERLKGLIELRLPVNVAEPRQLDPEADTEARSPQPPEAFWRKVRNYGLSCLALMLALSGALLVLGADAANIMSAIVLALLAGAVAVLAYRNGRSERAAGDQHREVLRRLAEQTGLQFNADDAQGLVSALPDFACFRGPRCLYNVAAADDPAKPVLFEFTSGQRLLGRDGMGCAFPVAGLSHGGVSVVPFPQRAESLRKLSATLLGRTDYVEDYAVKAENEGRARELLAPQFIELIRSWAGDMPPPRVCLKEGMIAVSVRRAHGLDGQALSRLYEYGSNLRQVLEGRIRELRATSPPGEEPA